jgi:flagellar hook-length control protein FliK
VGRTSTVSPALVEAARGLQQEGGGRTSLVVRLDPPELGAVVVRLTVLDGRVDVHLRTPDLTARADLQAQTWDVQQVLRAHGLDLGSYDVKHGELFTGGGQSEARTPDRGTPQQRRPADGHSGQLSLNTTVTDDVTSPQSAGTWL